MRAQLVNDATIMRVSYTTDDRAEAEAGADAIADAYLQFRGSQADTRVETIVDQLEQRRSALREDLLRINTIIRDARPGSGRAVQAETDRQLANIELDKLAAQINTFLGLDTRGGTVLTAADANPTSVAPSRGLVIGTGIAAGLLLGILAAFLLHLADRRIRDAHDVRRAGGGQVLGELTGNESAVPAPEREVDTIRSVRELLFATLSDDPPVVAVADFTPGSSGGDVAVNLAHAVAETGRRVDLVMADSDPEVVDRTAQALGLAPAASSEGVRRFTAGPLTLVAPARGTVGLADAGVDHGDAMTVVAVPHGAAHSSLLAAGRLGHAVVLVVAKGATRKSAVADAAQEISVIGAKVHGTVLVPKKRQPAPQPTR
jgi:Mrp family chromosome partitioning ATPase